MKEAATTSTAPAAGPSVTLTSTRNDLIKDIESHIEIIYECLDELNETAMNTTGSGVSLNKTTSNELITISSETSSQETEKTLNETIENDDAKSGNDTTAQDESKNE